MFQAEEELGYAAELWTRSLLAQHVRREALRAGHPSLSPAAKATVQRILAEQPLHPEPSMHRNFTRENREIL